MGETMSCNQCMHDLEDEERNETTNMLDGLGKENKYQLRYRWSNNKLVEVREEKENSQFMGLHSGGRYKEPPGIDPRFVPEYEIICDGQNMNEKNNEPRNFTLSLSAIHPLGEHTEKRNGYREENSEAAADPFGDEFGAKKISGFGQVIDANQVNGDYKSNHIDFKKKGTGKETTSNQNTGTTVQNDDQPPKNKNKKMTDENGTGSSLQRKESRK